MIVHSTQLNLNNISSQKTSFNEKLKKCFLSIQHGMPLRALYKNGILSSGGGDVIVDFCFYLAKKRKLVNNFE